MTRQLERMDAFIEAEIVLLQAQYPQSFDERRAAADAAGWLRYGLPASLGGQDGANLDMAVIREHLAARGLGLHNDLQDESSIVGNFPMVITMGRSRRCRIPRGKAVKVKCHTLGIKSNL